MLNNPKILFFDINLLCGAKLLKFWKVKFAYLFILLKQINSCLSYRYKQIIKSSNQQKQ